MPVFCIVLQEKIPGVEAVGFEGRALSKYSDQVDQLATQAQVRPLTSFFSVRKGEVEALLDGGEVPNLPEEQWFTAEEGLTTVRALSAALEDSRQQNLDLIRELAEFGNILEAARAKNIRWHLAIDY